MSAVNEINEILFSVWNPIGVRLDKLPKYEYLRYAKALHNDRKEISSTEDIVDRLKGYCERDMRVRFNEEKARRAAEHILLSLIEIDD